MQLRWKHYHVPPAIFTNTLSRTQPPEKYEIFEHWSENRIASYLTMEPGQGLVGTPVFDDTLESDFLKSCEEPIIVNKDDSEYNAALKRQMIETKIEIRQRMADGEKLGDILLETHKEMQKLAAVKSEIEQLVHESLKEAKSEADIDDLMTAANKMLEDKGVAPISLNPVIKRNLMRHIINEGE